MVTVDGRNSCMDHAKQRFTAAPDVGRTCEDMLGRSGFCFWKPSQGTFTHHFSRCHHLLLGLLYDCLVRAYFFTWVWQSHIKVCVCMRELSPWDSVSVIIWKPMTLLRRRGGKNRHTVRTGIDCRGKTEEGKEGIKEGKKWKKENIFLFRSRFTQGRNDGWSLKYGQLGRVTWSGSAVTHVSLCLMGWIKLKTN